MLFTVSGAPAIIELQRQLTSLRIDEWLREDVFHFKWWFLLGIFIVSISAWWILVNKTRLHEISLYAALTMIITLGLDEYGEELTLWDYPIDIIPIFPPLTAVDLASLPTVYSLIYQYFTTWKSFILASLVMSTVFCFVLEPILEWAKFYHTITWKYYYGFPIYPAIAICIRFVVIKIFALTEKYREKS